MFPQQEPTAVGLMKWRNVLYLKHKHACLWVFLHMHTCIHTHTILTIYNHIYQHSASESVCFSHSAIQVPLAGYPQYLLSGISFLLITVKLDQFSMSGLHSCPLNSCVSAWKKLPDSSSRVLCEFSVFSVL